MLTDIHRHYPGTPRHQATLRTIVAHYENDQRILAVAVFGSLGRGNWDQFSDIDLDVVIADQVRLDPVEELTQLCLTFNPLGKHCAVIIRDDTDAGDVVFESLLQLSARYHPLATTSLNIVDSLQVPTGRSELATERITGASVEPLCAVCGCRRYRLAATQAMGSR